LLGRYDGLFSQIGGKPAPAAGFAMGNERLITLLQAAKRAPRSRAPDAYLVFQGEGTLEYAFAVSEALRSAGYSVGQHAGGGSFKSQMKKADSSGAEIALIVGESELVAREVSVKHLRRDAAQYTIALDRLIEGFAQAMQQAKADRT